MGNPSVFIKEEGAPRMYLGDYLQSLFVRKTRPLPVPFRFLGFVVKITLPMFESIPKYIRGRESLDKLTKFLDTIVIPMKSTSSSFDLCKVFKDQPSYFPVQIFITQGVFSRKIKKMLDKKSHNKITVLRHLGVLQEQRKAQTVCYI